MCLAGNQNRPRRRFAASLPLLDEDMSRRVDQTRAIVNVPAAAIRIAPGRSRHLSLSSSLATDAVEAIEAAIKRHYGGMTLPTIKARTTAMMFLRKKAPDASDSAG